MASTRATPSLAPRASGRTASRPRWPTGPSAGSAPSKPGGLDDEPAGADRPVPVVGDQVVGVPVLVVALEVGRDPLLGDEHVVADREGGSHLLGGAGETDRGHDSARRRSSAPARSSG